jgi:hypothetical protein
LPLFAEVADANEQTHDAPNSRNVTPAPAGRSFSKVGRSLKISMSAAAKYVSMARAAGVDWALAQTLSDEELEACLYRPPLPRSSHQLAPDFALVHQELKPVLLAGFLIGVGRAAFVGLITLSRQNHRLHLASGTALRRFFPHRDNSRVSCARL